MKKASNFYKQINACCFHLIKLNKSIKRNFFIVKYKKRNLLRDC